ncbi:hypothetical protein [Cellulosimicrobium marinum]|uniref:hypothetical protein n=1 Tax=Cellulosimicrobium marinum TaxID=1638992 RepID=UPI001E4877D7|nr:hypothetical protein [Cellulosimicrobium marinum]MCB7136808.1 hypothetical protein [Cellulosimicrobium marinum]
MMNIVSIHIALVGLLVVAPVAVLVWLVAAVTVRPPADQAPPGVTDPAAARRARRHAGTGAALALVAAAGALLLAAHTAASTLSGLGAGVAVGLLPATAGLTFLAALALTEVTWPSPAGARRSASLVPRSVHDVAPARLRRWTWTTGAVAALACLLGGLTARPDGRSVGYVDDLVSGASSPYPGWFYGLPLLGACLLVLLGAEACLRLVVRRPAVAGVDARWDLDLRRLSAHRLLRGAQLTVGLTAAGMLLVGGTAAHRLAAGAAANGASAGAAGPAGVVALTLGVALLLAVVAVALVPGPAPRLPDRAGDAQHSPGAVPATRSADAR